VAGQLEGLVAIVTGAARGIGLAIAERYAREGARVVIDDVDDAAGLAATGALAERGGQVRYVHADVSKTDEVAALVASTEQAFGPVDILVNNALPASRHVAGNDWDPLVDVCLKGPWYCMAAVLPRMMERRCGSIINISSTDALAGYGPEHVYSAVKAGLIGMSRSMAVSHGKYGVRINVICPGSVMTEQWALFIEQQPDLVERHTQFNPIGRLGRPDDIAAAALYLAGPDSSFATGSVMVVDGGLTAGNPVIAP
jgi:NAD(P)-dependent dehydrogenase (short-subunit alcohol dehydrogenase family)